MLLVEICSPSDDLSNLPENKKNQIQENQSINNYATLVCVQWTRIMFMSSFTAYDPSVEYFNVKYLAKEL